MTKEELAVIREKLYELERRMRQPAKDDVKSDADEVADRLKELSSEELDALKAIIDGLQKNRQDDGGQDRQ